MSGGGSVYSPLPQSNSDIDESSEEELHSSHENNIVNRKVKVDISVNGDNKQSVSSYRKLSSNRDVKITINGYEPNLSSNVIIRTSNSNNNNHHTVSKSMSLCRKICFILSILMCILTIIVFLWIIPCDIGTCTTVKNSNSWEKTLLDIEIKGPINTVPAASGTHQNLVLLASNPVKQNDKKDGIVISLLGKDGEVSWWSTLTREPKDIDCHIFDADSNGVFDCIIVGEDGLLTVIDAVSGTKIWDVNGGSGISDIDFPLILPDLNDDGVSELVTTCRITSRENHNSLVVISGRNGSLLGHPVVLSNCYTVHHLILEKDSIFSFTCTDTNNEKSIQTITFQELFTKVKNETLFTKTIDTKLLKQHRFLHLPGDSNTFVVNIDHRRLLVENHDICPGNCTVSVSLRDERAGQENKTVWHFREDHTFGFVPTPLIFNQQLTGFVLKFWEWHEEKTKRRNSPGSHNVSNPWRVESNVLEMMKLKDSDHLDKVMFEHEEAEERKRLKRDKSGNNKRRRKLTKEKMKERVVLVMFNQSDPVVNASETDVVRLCRDITNCRPQLDSHKYSLLIADLDGDNSQELISFSSSYVFNETNSNEIVGELQSKVRVVRLEVELNKLYDGFSKQLTNPPTMLKHVLFN